MLCRRAIMRVYLVQAMLVGTRAHALTRTRARVATYLR